MKYAMILVLLAMPAVFAIDQPSEPLPVNAHEFEWKATSKAGDKFSGHSIDHSINGAYHYVQTELDHFVDKDVVDSGVEFEVEIEWKGKKFKRTLTAKSKYPVQLPRGPNKDKESPRGPLPR